MASTPSGPFVSTNVYRDLETLTQSIKTAKDRLTAVGVSAADLPDGTEKDAIVAEVEAGTTEINESPAYRKFSKDYLIDDFPEP